MNTFVVLRSVVLVAALTACGGGGSSGSDPAESPLPTGLPNETFLIKGETKFNFHDYCVSWAVGNSLQDSLCSTIRDSSRISLDGVAFARAGLDAPGRRGSSAIVSGARTSGVATVDLERVVAGPVQAVDAAHARIQVLGQRVYVMPYTDIDDYQTFDVLRVGEYVSVGGNFSADGDVVAMAIHREPSSAAFMLRGILNLTANGRVQIGEQTFGELADIRAFGFPSAPASGDAVLLAGELTSNGTPTASSMRYIGGAWADGNEDIRVLSGTITRRAHAADLAIDGFDVDCTLYPCSDMNSSVGTLAAVTRVSSLRRVVAIDAPVSGDVTVSGPVDAVDTDDDALTILGFAVQGIPATKVTDRDGLPAEIASIQPNDIVTATGSPVGSAVIAGSIATTTADAWAVSFRAGAPYVLVEASAITVLGQRILIDASTEQVASSFCRGYLPSISNSYTHVTIRTSRTTSGDLLAQKISLVVPRGACI